MNDKEAVVSAWAVNKVVRAFCSEGSKASSDPPVNTRLYQIWSLGVIVRKTLRSRSEFRPIKVKIRMCDAPAPA